MKLDKMPGAESHQEKTRKIFDAFLSKHHATMGTISEDSITLGQIMESEFRLPILTRFRALDDTLLYANLLTTLLSIVPTSRMEILIDFGAGSSVPTIKALLSSDAHSSLKVFAVDNDPDAIGISKKNAEIFGLAHRYNYCLEDMLGFLSRWKLKAGHALAANPPYAPAPSGLMDPFFHPADGGWDGTKYLEPLLLHPMPANTTVALRWCSLDNPEKIIPIIEHNYTVLHLEAHRSPFGTYTSAVPLKDHLDELHRSGISVFTVDDNGRREFTSLGCILRRR